MQRTARRRLQRQHSRQWLWLSLGVLLLNVCELLPAVTEPSADLSIRMQLCQAKAAEKLACEPSDLAARITAAVMVNKMRPAGENQNGAWIFDTKQNERLGLILPTFKTMLTAINDSPLPQAYQKDLIVHLGARFLFPIRQSPTYFGKNAFMTMIKELPSESIYVSLPEGQTLADILTQHWPDFALLSPLQQLLVYRHLEKFNPHLYEVGSHLHRQTPPQASIIRGEVGPLFQYHAFLKMFYDYLPDLLPIGIGNQQGDILSTPMGGAFTRETRYHLASGAKVLLPSPAYLAAASQPKGLTFGQ